eukprot:TRINITY_DN21445_c0_g1_i1.p1 TRINITY_DN21445_c0_g1~~TRINITY_DN21445_c0_g1_i1.p1  ORF type:complete len:110 (-),score=7.44 TRINITY_DN21445_c0_g1_i1:23-352(-)
MQVCCVSGCRAELAEPALREHGTVHVGAPYDASPACHIRLEGASLTCVLNGSATVCQKILLPISSHHRDTTAQQWKMQENSKKKGQFAFCNSGGIAVLAAKSPAFGAHE